MKGVTPARVVFTPTQGGLSGRPPLTSFGSLLYNSFGTSGRGHARWLLRGGFALQHLRTTAPGAVPKVFEKGVSGEEHFADGAKGSSPGCTQAIQRSSSLMPQRFSNQHPGASWIIPCTSSEVPFGRVWEGALGSKASSRKKPRRSFSSSLPVFPAFGGIRHPGGE